MVDIILLERVEHLGHMGQVVKVKPGYARNYLLPHKKALRATADNMKFFEAQRAVLEANNLKRRDEASAIGGKMDGVTVIIIRQAGETGQLYGSVSARDIAEAIEAAGFAVTRNQVVLDHPIKTLGVHALKVRLHPELSVGVSVNVAQSTEEAAAQARGLTTAEIAAAARGEGADDEDAASSEADEID